jgi:PAS domain S-box-containing protein
MNDDNKTKKQLVQELTELRSQNAALKESESADKYRSLVENIRDVIYELDSQGVVLYISPAIRDMLGYDSAEIVGKNFIEFAHKDDLSSLAEWFSELRKGREDPSEYRILNKSSEIRWTRTKTRPIMEDGLFKGAHGILIDVTAQRRVEEALREREEFFKAIIQNSSDIILIVDKLGTITYASSSIERSLGYGPDELIGKRTLDLIVSDDKPKAIADFGRALLTKEVPIPNVFRIRHKNGAERILEGIGKNLLDNPIVKGFVMNVRDITERKQAENALRESEDRYRELTDFLPLSISTFEVDAAGSIISYNRTALEAFGYNEEDFKEGMNALQFFAPEEWQRIGENMGKVIQGTSTPGQEFIFLRKDGSKFPGLIYASPNIHQNVTVGIRGVIIDITERKQEEEALRESEEKYRWVLNNMVDVITVMDMNLHFTYVSPSIMRMRGYTAEEATAQTLEQALTPESLQISAKVFEEEMKLEASGTADPGRSRILELEQYRKDGSIVWMENRLSFMRDKAQKPVGIISVSRDITDRKRTEEALRESEAHYRLLAEHMTDIVWMMDLDLNVTWLSPSAMKARGFSVDEISALPLDRQLTPESLGKAVNWLGKLMRLEKEERNSEPDGILSRELEFYCKDGRTIVLDCTFQFIRDEQGKATGILAEGKDITARKRAEEELQRTLESLRKAFGATVQVMVSAVETRDPYTAGHQVRSADLARAIATEMGLPQDKIDGIRMAGSIHDIGKLSIPAEILSNPTKLPELEFSLIKEHAKKGYEMLKDVESPWPLAEIVRQHHERMDGSGYPRNLKGDEICMEARILAVADVVEAMASHRPYRPGLGIDAALNEIEKNKGIFYDDAVADACLRLFREKGFQLAMA